MFPNRIESCERTLATRFFEKLKRDNRREKYTSQAANLIVGFVVIGKDFGFL
jgi:hypothetical protein